MQTPFRIEWLVIAATLLIVVALVAPVPNWKETVSESRHTCGNCQQTVRTYRWWRMDSEVIVPTVVFAVRPGHEHDWWQYSRSHVSCNEKWARSRAARYRDGRQTWSP